MNLNSEGCAQMDVVITSARSYHLWRGYEIFRFALSGFTTLLCATHTAKCLRNH